MCKHIIEQVGDTEHLQYFAAQAWNMLGEAYLLQRQIKQGQEAKEKFFKLLLSLPDDPSWQENVERYLLLSKASLDNGKPDESRKFSAKALQYLEEKEEPQGLAHIHMTRLLGCASVQSGDLVGALEYYQEALRILKACGSDGMAQPTLYLPLGGIQKVLGLYIEATSTLKQGLIYAEQSGNVNLQYCLLVDLIDIYKELLSPETATHNFILSQREAKEALQRYLEAHRNLIQSYPALRPNVLDHLSGEIFDLKHVEEVWNSAVEKGDLAFRGTASFLICAERLDPRSPNQDDACAREAFEECKKCLKAWDSQNGNVLTVASEAMRLKLASHAFSLGELEEAEDILNVLLQSYERILDQLFMAGDASEEIVLKFRESRKVPIIAMMEVQLQLACRHRNLQAGTASSQMPSANLSEIHSLKALIWSERARARTVMFHLAPGFRGLNLQPGDKREFKPLLFQDAYNLPYDHHPETLLESLILENDPLLEAPWRHAIKDDILFNIDDSYALNFIMHAVRDSKMVFLEYFILNEAELLIIVVMEIPDSTDGSLTDGCLNLPHVKEGVCPGVLVRYCFVDIKATLDDDDKGDALEETKGLAHTVCFQIFSDLEQDRTFNYNAYIL
jgi:tetratricopeptide (TPR) repeat protein